MADDPPALEQHHCDAGANFVRAGWSWGCVSAVDSELRTIWIVNAHRDDGKRFVVHADEKLTAFVELEATIRREPRICLTSAQNFRKTPRG